MNQVHSFPQKKAALRSVLRNCLHTYPRWNFSPPRVQYRAELERFGSGYGGYWLDPSALHSESVVYSLGIGEDISFDLALIANFGVNVHAFDPTPAVQAWLASQSVPPQFRFHSGGIAAHDGQEFFHLPPRKDWISHSVLSASQFSSESVKLPVIRLCTAMKQQGFTHIDVLKMDIEGAEYTVIDDLVREEIPVAQLLVEFHHRFSSVGTGRTRKTLALLERYGMKIAYVCPRKEVFTLVQQS